MNHKHVPRVVQDTDLVIGLKRGVTITQSQHGYGRDPNLPQGLTVPPRPGVVRRRAPVRASGEYIVGCDPSLVMGLLTPVIWRNKQLRTGQLPGDKREL